MLPEAQKATLLDNGLENVRDNYWQNAAGFCSPERIADYHPADPRRFTRAANAPLL
jgi:hypothetical protein